MDRAAPEGRPDEDRDQAVAKKEKARIAQGKQALARQLEALTKNETELDEKIHVAGAASTAVFSQLSDQRRAHPTRSTSSTGLCSSF